MEDTVKELSGPWSHSLHQLLVGHLDGKIFWKPKGSFN